MVEIPTEHGPHRSQIEPKKSKSGDEQASPSVNSTCSDQRTHATIKNTMVGETCREGQPREAGQQKEHEEIASITNPDSKMPFPYRFLLIIRPLNMENMASAILSPHRYANPKHDPVG